MLKDFGNHFQAAQPGWSKAILWLVGIPSFSDLWRCNFRICRWLRSAVVGFRLVRRSNDDCHYSVGVFPYET